MTSWRGIEGFAKKQINEQESGGKNALHNAVEQGHVHVASYLLEQGADPNRPEKYKFSDTPLLIALSHGRQECVRVLLAHGANPNLTNSGGITPLMRASEAGYLQIVIELLGRNAQVNARTPQGVSALHLAAGEGHTEIVRQLLDSGAAITAMSDNSRTALHQAAYRGNAELVTLLLERGAKPQVNQQDKAGETPLARAIWKGHAVAEKLLRDAGGADTPSILFQRAYSAAVSRRNAEAIPLLHELIEKRGLLVGEPAWRMEIRGHVYEIGVPYLLTQLVLAECYKRTGKADEWEKHLKAAQAVWPASAESYQLYTRRVKIGQAEFVDSFALTKTQLQGQIDSKDKLPVKGWITYTQYEAYPDGGQVERGKNTMDGVIH